MSIDFGALTHAVVAGVPDVRSCLMVSRDGLALGASPAAEEDRTLEVWTRIGTLGDVERGFITVRDEIWVFCRRGTYGAVATASPTARPGLILDHLEQMVLMAEEARVRREGVRQGSERETASLDAARGLRTTLHRDRATEPATPEPVLVDAPEATSTAEAEPEAAESQPTSEANPAIDEVAEMRERRDRSADDTPVDPVELSREFAAILAEQEQDEE
ncbi:MAG: hypothetical protein ACRDHO_02810 [Actinomycetota bacterium]